MSTRHRLPAAAAAALLLATGAAQAQTPGATTTTTTQPPTTGTAGASSTTTTTVQGATPPATDATPPSDTAGASATPPSGAAFVTLTPTPGADVVTVLTQSGQFSTLLKAADATNLTSVLKTPGLTVFAPTDTAFAALPPGVLDNLMKPDNLPQLQKLLAYHLVNTKIPAIKGHAQTQVATAAAPSKVTLDGTGDKVKVNDATALQSAVSVAGGATIYPIDKVLSPDFTPPPATTTESATSTTETAPAASSSTTTTKKSTTRRKR